MANFMELAPRAQRQIIRRMEPLEPPALHQAQAAYGWLELGNVEEAFAELERLPESCSCCRRCRRCGWIV